MGSPPATERDRLLYRAAAELTSSLDLPQVLQRLVASAAHFMKAARGFVVLIDPQSAELSVEAAWGEGEGEAARGFFGSRTVIEEVMKGARAVVTMDATSDPRFREHDSVVLGNVRSILAVPLATKGSLLGALYVDNPYRAGIFGPEDRDFLQALADIAAPAIDNARLYQRLSLNLAQAERVRATFERYVNKQVTDWVLSSPAAELSLAAGAQLTVAVLATDLAGFSRLAQKTEAAALVRLLNDTFAPVIDAVIDEGGNVDKFLGDGVLAVFGAPVAIDAPAPRAFAAARRIRAALAELNRDRQATGEVPVELGIGVDVGTVVAGNVGSERRLEYTSIGVPVNHATRLAKRRPAGLFVSAATWTALGESHLLRPAGPSPDDGQIAYTLDR